MGSHSHFSVIAFTPYALANFPQRSPNLPPSTTTAVSPLRRKFTKAASIAPVPLAANTRTSCFVWKSHPNPSRTRPNTASNSGERWWTMGRAIRKDSLSGTGVGPGVSRRIFFTALLLSGGGWIGVLARRVKTPPQRSPDVVQ